MNEKLKTLSQNVALNLHEINEMLVNETADGLETYVQLKKIEKLFKDVLKGAQEVATEKAFETKGTFVRFGAEIQCKNGSKVWNFKDCQQWGEKKKELTDIESDLKNAYALYERGKHAFNEETGEQVEIPTVSYKADNITVKIFK